MLNYILISIGRDRMKGVNFVDENLQKEIRDEIQNKASSLSDEELAELLSFFEEMTVQLRRYRVTRMLAAHKYGHKQA